MTDSNEFPNTRQGGSAPPEAEFGRITEKIGMKGPDSDLLAAIKEHPREWEQFQGMVINAATERSNFFRTFSGRHENVNSECGYTEVTGLSAEDFRNFYDCFEIATRVVEVMPKQCWKVQPSIYENEDAETETPFEAAWKQLPKDLEEEGWYEDENGSIIWEYLSRADILSGIGHFGIILLGIDDGRNLDEPVEGIIAITPEGHPKTPVGTTDYSDQTGGRSPGIGAFISGTEAQYDGAKGGSGKNGKGKKGRAAGPKREGTFSGQAVPHGIGRQPLESSGNESRPIGSDRYTVRSQYNMHSRPTDNSNPEGCNQYKDCGGGAEIKISGKSWKKAYSVPTDGAIHDVGDGTRVIHHPATKLKNESVLVAKDGQYFRRRNIRGFWNPSEPTDASIEFGDREQPPEVFGSEEQILRDLGKPTRNSRPTANQKPSERKPSLPDSLVHNGELESLRSLGDYDPQKNPKGLNAQEKALLDKWEQMRTVIVNERRDAADKYANERGKVVFNEVTQNDSQSPYGGMGGMSWAPYGIPYLNDTQYMGAQHIPGAFGGYATVPGQALAGTDQQYYGVQFGPSERMPEKPTKQKNKLLFLRVYDESLVQVVRYEWNVRNPRFGQPVMYRVTLNDPRETHSGVGLPLATVFVHWSRIVHLNDTHGQAGSSEIFSPPRMRCVYNRLLDLYKLYGGSAEMYWRGAFPGISLETHPQLGGDVTLPTNLGSYMQKYFMGLQRWLAIAGMSAKTLSPQVTDPTGQISVGLQAICIKLGIPQRIFLGSERGELASSQDDEAFNENVMHRQETYITPRIICRFVGRLILIGVLPEPKQYHCVWPDLEAIGAAQKAQIALTRVQTLATYVGGNVASVLTPADLFTEVMDIEPEKALSLLENVIKGQASGKGVYAQPPQSEEPEEGDQGSGRPGEVEDEGDEERIASLATVEHDGNDQ